MNTHNSQAHNTTLHGVLLCIEYLGVLITGAAGVGKSSTTLRLIDRGHTLVADDVVTIQRIEQKVIGSCPEPLQDLLKVRGVEIFNIRKLFGDRAISSALPIDLIIVLDPTAEIPVFEEQADSQTILGISIPRIILSGQHSDTALLIESLVKTHVLHTQGYNAQHEFIQHAHAALGATS